jgi:U4/U6 small nuclear ribonucleoprotein PRP4
MRTGRGVFLLEGHIKQVLAIDFSPDGYRVATGGDDHTVKVRMGDWRAHGHG